jgi:hypothetical protein
MCTIDEESTVRKRFAHWFPKSPCIAGKSPAIGSDHSHGVAAGYPRERQSPNTGLVHPVPDPAGAAPRR